MENKYCKCSCGTKLRKDNKTGYQRGHKPCPVCGTFVLKSHTECCSKSCSTKLHWQRHPEMRENRIWNESRLKVREQHKDEWRHNISKARNNFIANGGEPWNKGKKGLQVAWNKGLPTNEQPNYGTTRSNKAKEQTRKTNLKKFGVANPGMLSKSSPRSKKEILLEEVLLPAYEINQRIGRFKPDYINYETNHIVEVFGNYWHCNPNQYDKDYWHSQIKLSAEEIWNKDHKRIEILKEKGYTVTIVWENDINQFIKEYK